MAALMIQLKAKKTRDGVECQGNCLPERGLSLTTSEMTAIYALEPLKIATPSCFAAGFWIPEGTDMNVLYPANRHFLGQRLL